MSRIPWFNTRQKYADERHQRQVWRWVGALLFSLIPICLLACRPRVVAPTPTRLLATATLASQPRATPTLRPTPTPQPTADATLLSAGDPYIPELGSAGYDVQHYTLRLTLDPAQVLVQGEATLQLRSLMALDSLALDLVGFEVESATVNGASVAAYRQGRKLLLPLTTPLPAGAEATVNIRYAGAPVQEPSRYNHLLETIGLNFTADGRIFAASQPDGARYWFPCNDHPRDKALFRFEIQVPNGLLAIANGRPQAAQTTAAGTLYVWEHDAPLATYLATVVVGPYETITAQTPGGVRLQHYVMPAQRVAFEAAAQNLPAAVDWLAGLLGPYPFDRFGFVTVPSPHLSLETQPLALLSESNLQETILIHELAHMWFGNAVSLLSWQEMWRNEGLATYMEYVWRAQGDSARLEQEMAALRQHVQARQPMRLGQMPPERLLGFENYLSGALLIHQLHTDMGDEAFFNGLRLFLDRHRAAGNASDADFRAAMEEAAGRSLSLIWATEFGAP